MTKEEEIGKVTAQLDAILDKLRDNVEQLNEILTQPLQDGAPDDGKNNDTGTPAQEVS